MKRLTLEETLRALEPALREAMAGGVKREELWITSKVWNDMHGEGDVLVSCANR